MKKLKELGMAFIAIIACISMAACSNKIDVPVADDEQEVYTVKIGWSGEILDIKDEPLSRATTDNLYGIQVYSTPDKELEEGKTATWTPYAYGLFDDPSAISINLLKGYKYKFVATMVVNGKNRIYAYTDDSKKRYAAPFSVHGLEGVAHPLSNSFAYATSAYMENLNIGKSFIENNKEYDRPNTDRYYGELAEFKLGTVETASIPMKRASFGATFVAVNSVGQNGTLEIQMTGAPKMEIEFTDDESDKFEVKDIFTFYDVDAAYEKDDYTETIPVTINWHRADDTTVPLGKHDITYKRNRNTIVTVKITNAGTDSDLGFSIDESEQTDIEDMEKGDDVTIENGEVVEVDLSWFNPNQYISYVSNYEQLTTNDDASKPDIARYTSYISCPSTSISKMEIKFQMANIDNWLTYYNSLQVWSSGRISLDNNQMKVCGNTYSWNDLEIGISDIMVLNISYKDKSVKLNGVDLEHSIASDVNSYTTGGYFLSAGYSEDYDDGWLREWKAGVSQGSKLYYVKFWDENDELIYLGAASTALNPTTNEVENCWRSYYDGTTTYQFAHNSETLSNYQPYGGGTDE